MARWESEGRKVRGGREGEGTTLLWPAFVTGHDVTHSAERRGGTSEKRAVSLNFGVIVEVVCVERGKQCGRERKKVLG